MSRLRALRETLDMAKWGDQVIGMSDNFRGWHFHCCTGGIATMERYKVCMARRMGSVPIRPWVKLKGVSFEFALFLAMQAQIICRETRSLLSRHCAQGFVHANFCFGHSLRLGLKWPSLSPNFWSTFFQL